MRKAVVLCLVLLPFLTCSARKGRVERTIEDGVEVVLNRTEPYEAKNEKSGFVLERLFSIDTESDDVAGIGLGGYRLLRCRFSGEYLYRGTKNG